MIFPTMWYVRPTKPQSLVYYMSVKLLTEHHLESLSLKGGLTGSSESTIVKMPYCWKSHVVDQLFKCFPYLILCNQDSAPSIKIKVTTEKNNLINTTCIKYN